MYRRPPRSHAYSCRCAKCAPFYRKGSGGSGAWIWPLLIVVGLVCAGVKALSRVIAAHPMAAGVWAGSLVAGVALICGIFAVSRWAENREATRGKTAVLPSPARQAPAICAHLDAVKVENLLNPDGPAWAWLCYDCDPEKGTRLPEEFGNLRRLCCGTEHGKDHLRSCGHVSPAPDVPEPAAEPPAVPAGRVSWRWWCTCGASGSGHTATEAAAKVDIRRGTAAHQRLGHRYQFEWQNIG